MNIKNNNRFKETDDKIQKTLLNLLEIKDFNSITVREICTISNINRSTFYAHYLDIIDLIEKTEISLHKILAAQFEKAKNEDQHLSISDYLIIFLNNIYDYKNFYRARLQTRQIFPIEQGFHELLNYFVKPHCVKIGLESEAEMMYFFVYFQAGFTMILKRWVDNDFQESPAQLAEIIFKCLSNGLNI